MDYGIVRFGRHRLYGDRKQQIRYNIQLMHPMFWLLFRPA